MSLADIQRAVDSLPADDRQRLTAWMVSRYPVLRIERLMAIASGLVERGQWTPSPPTEDNYPKGKSLDHATRVAEELDLEG